MKTFLNQPFRSVESQRDKLISIPVFGLFIFLFLFLFRPFGMTNLKTLQHFYLCVGFGLVTIFVLFIFRFLLEPRIAWINRTMGLHILWDVVIASSVGVANFFYVSIVLHQVLMFKYLLAAIWTAILVGAIPVTIGYIIRFNRIYRKALTDTALKPEEVLWESEITLRAGNPRNELKLNPKNIVYLCSNDNYVTVVSARADGLKKNTIRGTLKSLESELRHNKRFVRCHKCFIVNLDYASGVNGHNQNMVIRLASIDTEIPVSRTYARIITSMLKKI